MGDLAYKTHKLLPCTCFLQRDSTIPNLCQIHQLCLSRYITCYTKKVHENGQVHVTSVSGNAKNCYAVIS